MISFRCGDFVSVWRYFFFQNTQGLIFVVDSNDRERVAEASEELQKMLREDELRDAKLLVFANKQVRRGGAKRTIMMIVLCCVVLSRFDFQSNVICSYLFLLLSRIFLTP